MDPDPDPFVWDGWSEESSLKATTDGSPSSSWDELNDLSTGPDSLSPTTLFHHGMESGGGASPVFSDGSFHVVDLPQDAYAEMHTDATYDSFCSVLDTSINLTRSDPYTYHDNMSLDMSTPMDFAPAVQDPVVSFSGLGGASDMASINLTDNATPPSAFDNSGDLV